RLSFIGLDKMIHQFQGADGAGKVIVQIDSEFFFAHVLMFLLQFYPLVFQSTNYLAAAGDISSSGTAASSLDGSLLREALSRFDTATTTPKLDDWAGVTSRRRYAN